MVVQSINLNNNYKLKSIVHLLLPGDIIESNIDGSTSDDDDRYEAKVVEVIDNSRIGYQTVVVNRFNEGYDTWHITTESDGWIKVVSRSDGAAGSRAPGQLIDETHLDRLVLDDGIKGEILSTLKQVENHDKIFTEWGLGDVIDYGKGMTFMFYGLPGTGKTFGATLIAKALGKELLILSASEIQSSEPGAANRSIEQAFKTAKDKKKVLFLDECDSLIFNRQMLGMVLASEVNTLLTCIEKFEGVLILATNRVEDMDSALERRISLIVEFPMPNKAQRLQIWKKLIPEKMPVKNVDFDRLANHEISGGLIKNAVLGAARLAAADKSDYVQHEHFDKAVTRVLSSTGIMGNDKNPRGRVDVGVGRGSSTTVGVGKKRDITTSIDTYLKDK